MCLIRKQFLASIGINGTRKKIQKFVRPVVSIKDRFFLLIPCHVVSLPFMRVADVKYGLFPLFLLAMQQRMVKTERITGWLITENFLIIILIRTRCLIWGGVMARCRQDLHLARCLAGIFIMIKKGIFLLHLAESGEKQTSIIMKENEITIVSFIQTMV